MEIPACRLLAATNPNELARVRLRRFEATVAPNNLLTVDLVEAAQVSEKPSKSGLDLAECRRVASFNVWKKLVKLAFLQELIELLERNVPELWRHYRVAREYP